MENQTLRSNKSTYNKIIENRRLSAPAKLQTFNKEEPKLLDKNLMEENLRVLCDNNRPIILNRNKATIFHHYYPEGGWGWIVALSVATVHAITYGIQFGFLLTVDNFYLHNEDLLNIKSGYFKL
jgi:hypothetical protein